MKFAYRLPPCSPNRPAATQSWVEDMAAKGYHLYPDCCQFGIFTFTKGEAKQIRCRLEATGTWDGIYAKHRTPAEEELSLFRELGWEWMGRWGQFHIYITEDPDAPELHTDPRVQAITIQALIRHQRSALGYILIWLIVYLLAFTGFGIAWLAAYLSTPLMLLIAGLFLSAPLYQIGSILRFRHLQKQLEAGIPPKQHGNYRLSRWFMYLETLLAPVLFAVLLLTVLGDLDSRALPAESWPEDLPFPVVLELLPRASEAEEDADVELSAWSNILAVQSYHYTEYRGIVPGFDGYYAVLDISYHECSSEWFAAALARGYTQQADGFNFIARLRSDDPEITELDIPGADYAVTYLHGSPYLILRKGRVVIRIRYSHFISGTYPPEKLAALLVSEYIP